MAHFRKQPHTPASGTHERPAASPAPRVSSSAGADPTPDRIAARAYQIWVESGRPAGKDQENWYRAERELRGAQR